ncbi:MAG: type III-B CRISPR-associated protein Cas10/Cmr2 [Tannerellaceae bacterium]|nr:type III-B CRISPR-associated protein Cas10/Cmr2 [Tannerellaceae bacterium]MCD8263200.1 type III-B CRISPR-associated protein Cas10/Cmr2 [Tannerellaceae bacterium]
MSHYKFLSEDAFKKQEEQRLFPSLLEIAAPEKNSKDFKVYNEASYRLSYKELTDEEKAKNRQVVTRLENSLELYQKYIAIITADGDLLGQAISSFAKVNEDCKDGQIKLSQALFHFNTRVLDIINRAKAKAVFIGGDDLLILAPIYNNTDNSTVFNLIREIDEVFNNSMKEFLGDNTQILYPTLSFGLSITYYKHPMFEALDAAHSLLNGQAKESTLSSFLKDKK